MSGEPDKLAEYASRRDFTRTSEPAGGHGRSGGRLFVVQKHDARRLHYDFRIEAEGVLLSWAVTRGPSSDPRQKRLAVRVEDHPVDYGEFEGTIPEKQYGGGTVMLWDRGTWEPRGDVAEGLERGNLKMTLSGERMQGGWALIRMKDKGRRESWLLVKERDEVAEDRPDALTQRFETSVKTGRTMAEIASDAPARETEAEAETQEAQGRGADEPETGGEPHEAGGSSEADEPAAASAPAFREPQLATLVRSAPDGDDWLHETKFDGYRCLVALQDGAPTFWTRNGKDWTAKFSALSDAFADLPCRSALIDGEVMAAHVRGSAFSSLQKALSEGGSLVFFAFDLLALDGSDLAELPLIERRARLAELLSDVGSKGPLRMSEHVIGRGPEIFAAACRSGAEGIVSKRCASPYRSTRNRDWVKVKCTRRQEFVIGGTSPSDKSGRPFASLIVGVTEGESLRYAGRVGTGMDAETLADLERRMTPRRTSPFDDVPRAVASGARWVRPDLVCEVEYSEFTADGYLRHASYLGLREDKQPGEVRMERPDDDKAGDGGKGAKGDVVGGIAISSGGRTMFPEAGCTKLDIARHYERVGERMTQIAGYHPLSLLRCPDGIDGETFFQKHAGKGWPSALGRIEIEEKNGSGVYLYATRPASFVAAAQMGTVEFHMWGARTDKLDAPERVVFDLDPGEGVGWDGVRRAAIDLREWLRRLELEAGAIATGGKGVHVWVPLRRRHDWDAVRGFAKTVAHVMAEREPERFTATMSKATRKGRIFVDWLRNERGATAIAPYSLRARPGGPVAVPVEWEELETLPAANGFTMADMAERLERPCPYLALAGDLQSITSETVERLEAWASSGDD